MLKQELVLLRQSRCGAYRLERLRARQSQRLQASIWSHTHTQRQTEYRRAGPAVITQPPALSLHRRPLCRLEKFKGSGMEQDKESAH